MSERLRYACGDSSLGAFIAATSNQGLLSFEFGDGSASCVAALRRCFPAAAVEEDAAGMADTVARLADAAEHPERPHALPLDLRGSTFERRVWDGLRRIPAGQTLSYGAVATMLGRPGDARDVADACAANTIAILVPCHRVVKSDGSLSGYRWGVNRKRILLAREQRAMPFQLV